jgi:hypothetical protein
MDDVDHTMKTEQWAAVGSSRQQIHLMPDPFRCGASEMRDGAADASILKVLDEPAYVLVAADGTARIVADGGDRVSEGDRSDPAWRVEAVSNGAHRELLLLSSPRHRARLNGQAAPLVALAEDQDQIELAGAVLHVFIYHAVSIGPPSEANIGRECPVCRSAFTAASTVYTCWCCDRALHLEGEGALDCARLTSACPLCHRPIRLEQGYAHDPADLVGSGRVSREVQEVAGG